MKKLFLILTSVVVLSSCTFNTDLEPYGIVVETESRQMQKSDNSNFPITTATIDFKNLNASNMKYRCDPSVQVGDTLFLKFNKR